MTDTQKVEAIKRLPARLTPDQFQVEVIRIVMLDAPVVSADQWSKEELVQRYKAMNPSLPMFRSDAFQIVFNDGHVNVVTNADPAASWDFPFVDEFKQ